VDKKIINRLLLDGKSTVSEKIWLKSLKLFYKSFAKSHKKAINRALINVTPLLKVKQLKQKKKRAQLKEFPYIVNNKSRITLALKFFLTKTRNKKETKMYEKLVTELITVANRSGVSVNKKKSLYEYAFLKKKYFYYRWF
jgi:small subunit ribosomal protein S7